MTIQEKISFSSLQEKARIKKLADAEGMNLSNYIRSKLGLPPLNRGGARPNAGRPKQEEKQQKPE